MNILTFDIEDWFHILDHPSTKYEAQWCHYDSRIIQNVYRILDLLDVSDQQKATFFCLGWVAKKYPEVLKEIKQRGHEIGTHSYSHQLVYEQSYQEFEEDLKKSIYMIEDITGDKVIMYRSPGFSITKYTPWAFELLAKYGIQIDCSIFPIPRSHGGFSELKCSKPCWIDIEGIRLKEFPMSVFKLLNKNIIFSGGGYFRLFPLKVINYCMRESNYVMTYFHPRDFDKHQPIIKDLSILRKFKSYYGLGSALNKLESLLNEFEFMDIKTADSLINWGKTEIFYLEL